MAKGDDTRQAILSRAFEIANVTGISSLSIGRLAEETGLSKSGLFAHFGSKQALDVAVVEEGRRRFVGEVLMPALTKPRGEPRIREMFERWITWTQRPGGCFFVGAGCELDDRPGPARDALVQACKDWIDALATAARIAVDEGHFKADVDPQQFAFELQSMMVGAHSWLRLLRDPHAPARLRRAFERSVAFARVEK